MKEPVTTTFADLKGLNRQEQKDFLKVATEWLRAYPSTQQHMDGYYDEGDDVDFADEIAAYLSVQLQEMPNED